MVALVSCFKVFILYIIVVRFIESLFKSLKVLTCISGRRNVVWSSNVLLFINYMFMLYK